MNCMDNQSISWLTASEQLFMCIFNTLNCAIWNTATILIPHVCKFTLLFDWRRKKVERISEETLNLIYAPTISDVSSAKWMQLAVLIVNVFNSHTFTIICNIHTHDRLVGFCHWNAYGYHWLYERYTHIRIVFESAPASPRQYVIRRPVHSCGIGYCCRA